MQQMKKTLLVLLVLCCLLAFGTTVFAAEPVQVDDVDGLLAAIAAAEDGDIITLAGGEYALNQTISIKKSLTLQGATGEKPVLSRSNGLLSFVADEKSLTLENLEFQITTDNAYAIYYNGNGSTLTIQDCDFTAANDVDYGGNLVMAEGGADNALIFRDNLVDVAYRAALVGIGDDSVISGNIFNIDTQKVDTGRTSVIALVAENGPISVTGNKFYGANRAIAVDNAPALAADELTVKDNCFIDTRFAFELSSANEACGQYDLTENYYSFEGEVTALRIQDADKSGDKTDSWETEYKGYQATIYPYYHDEELTALTHGNIILRHDSEITGEFDSINGALAAASDGDSIEIPAGTYEEAIVINKGFSDVTLLGANADNDPNSDNWDATNATILTGGIYSATAGSYTGEPEKDINGFTIKGMTFQEKGIEFVNWWENGSLENLSIENNVFQDICVEKESDGQTTYPNIAAVHLNCSAAMAPTNVIFRHNRIENIGKSGLANNECAAFYCGSVNHLTLTDNVINNTTGNGLTIGGAQGNITITDNVLENWAQNGETGRAMRLSDSGANTSWTICRNKMLFDEIYPEEQIKLTGLGETAALSLAYNYWNGENPTADGLLLVSPAPQNLPVYPYYKDAEFTVLAYAETEKPIDTVVTETVEQTKDITPEQAVEQKDAINQAVETLQNINMAYVETSDSIVENMNHLEELYVAANDNIAPTQTNVETDKVSSDVSVSGAAISVPVPQESDTQLSAKIVIHDDTTVTESTVENDLAANKITLAADAVVVPLAIELHIVDEDDNIVAEAIQPKAPLTFRLPLPQDIEAKNVVILHYHSDGSISTIYPKLEKDDDSTYLVFRVNKLSTFAITNYAKKTNRPSGGSLVVGEATTYTITVTAGNGGTVSPGTTKVEENEDQTFTIQANTGYEVADVLVDGESIGAVTSYTFENVTEKHEISATFRKSDTANAPNFSDVLQGAWYYDSVQFVVENGLFNGVSDTTFQPSASMTRGMFVTVLARLANADFATYTESPFHDTAISAWYGPAVAWAAENEIVLGITDTTFEPDTTITREQMASMLYRYASFKQLSVTASGDLNLFIDGDAVSTWAQEPMQWAIANGLINGKGNQTLDPRGIATRAEVATMIQKFCSNIAN